MSRRGMYYRRRESPLRGCMTIVMLGVLLGWAFTLFDHHAPARTGAAPATLTASPAPTDAPPTPAPLVHAAAPPIVPTLSMPTAGVVTRVVDVYLNGTSWDVSQLGDNAGHLEGTAPLNKTGNLVLVGHVEMADGSAGIFARLNQMTPGDPIILNSGKSEKHYTVAEVRKVAPDDLTVLYPTKDDQITLITCSDYNILQNTYQDRVVVVAKLSA